MSPRYRVTLIKKERKELETEPPRGKPHARRFIHPLVSLPVDASADGPAWGVTS